jgi:CRP-like cAMP-binding protein
MTEPGTPDVFFRHPFVQGLSDQHRARLAAGAKQFAASPREYLAREGEPAHAFYLLLAGHVEIGTHVAERGAMPIQTVGPGDVVGWSWLLPPYRWQFDARAVDPVQGMAFEGAWLRQLCENDHELGYHLLKQLLAVVSNRLAATRVQRLDIYQ